jgi:hypothetical protein
VLPIKHFLGRVGIAAIAGNIHCWRRSCQPLHCLERIAGVERHDQIDAAALAHPATAMPTIENALMRVGMKAIFAAAQRARAGPLLACVSQLNAAPLEDIRERHGAGALDPSGEFGSFVVHNTIPRSGGTA